MLCGQYLIKDLINILNDENSPYKKILVVHGGGKNVDKELDRRGIFYEKISSRSGIESRYTPKEVRDVYVEVMRNIEQHLLEKMREERINAYGFKPEETPVMANRKKDIVYVDKKTGKRIMKHDDYSGGMREDENTITNIRNKLRELFEEYDVIIFPPVGIDEEAGPLNINGDKMAAYLSGCVNSPTIVDLTDVEGIQKGGKLIQRVAFIGELDSLLEDKEVEGGMRRKVLEAKQAFERYNPHNLNRFIIASGKRKNPITLALKEEGCTVIYRP